MNDDERQNGDVVRNFIEQIPLLLAPLAATASGRLQLRKLSDILLQLADAMPAVEEVKPVHNPGPTNPPTIADSDLVRPVTSANPSLAGYAIRCRMKAKACRWLAKKLQLTADKHYDHVKNGDSRIRQEANQISEGCHLWMVTHDCPIASAEVYEELACCFDALGEAIQLFDQICVDETVPHSLYIESLHFVAEAQKMVHSLMPQFGRQADPDQLGVFHWLRAAACESQTFLPFMQSGSSVNPSESTHLFQRIADCKLSFEQVRKQRKEQRRLLNKLKYLGTQLLAGSEPVASTWSKIFQTVVELVEVHRLPPSNIELRTIVQEFADEIPADFEPSQPMRLVLRELDRYLDSQAESEDEDETPESINPDVHKVAALLKGRSVVLVGGEPEPERIAALERAFGVDVKWLGSQEHQSYLRFVPASTRDDVAVVLLAIRWASHSYGELEGACRKAGKPFVRLPRGLNPNMVAHEILNQVGNQLK